MTAGNLGGQLHYERDRQRRRHRDTSTTASGTINLDIYPNDDDPLLATNVTQTLGHRY
ncbi:MAG: hypothetical protein IPJ48_11580 [Propionivibrio sp.]|uniref:Uncharacterized protein n=1 Tax=Candidatus Propionivibrio dominans TaxID=2954373 RepID=A0A9D7IHG0_9RHOO|nr:hypothetical protein [Candidatus Propionivibrio dominans]